jgi:hypothetical protein
MCVHRWSQRFSPDVGGRLQSPFVGPQRKPLISQAHFFFYRGNHYVMSSMLSIVMTWWCIIDSVDHWLVPMDCVDNGVGLVFSHCIGYYDI